MSEEQRVVFTRRVLEFQQECIPRLEEASEPWDKDVRNIFDEGLSLVSAMPQAKNFCLVAYQFRPARKRLDNFYTVFYQLISELVRLGHIASDSQAQPAQPHGIFNGPSALRATPPSHLVIGAKFSLSEKTGKAGRPEKPRNIPKVPAAGVKLENTILMNADGSDPLQPTIGERPKHLDQYIHLLPEDLQAEAMGIRDMYIQLADLSNTLQHLCDDPKSTQKDRAYYAVSLCQMEDKISNLWARIDVAYAEATGKSVSDGYKQFLNEETVRINGVLKEKTFAEMTKFEIDSMDDGPTKDKAREARISRDKKFLRKDDRKGDEQHRQNLQDAAQELHDWGVLLTDTQAKVCKQYGCDIPADWVEPSVEERKKLRDKARNEKRKQERAEAKAEREAAKKAAEKAASALYQGGLSVFAED